MRRFSLLFLIPILFLSAISSLSQGLSTALQAGSSLERDLRPAQTHIYSVNLEKEQFVQLAIKPADVNILVRIFLPDGKPLREITELDEGEDGAYVELVSEFSGAYRFEIVSTAEVNAAATHYQIKVAELRKATDEELRAHKNESARKAKGLALLMETAQHLDQFRQPENRVEMQLEAAQLLWPSDEKQAQKLMAQAMEAVKQLIAQEADTEAEHEDGQLGMKLRSEVIRALAPHDPEAALKFLRATRQPETSSAGYGQADPEITLESTLVNQVIAADPKRAYELAEDMLSRSFSSQLIETLNRLSQKDPELASRLAHAMAKRIASQDLIKTREAAYLAGSLLQLVRSSQQLVKQNGDGTEHKGLLSTDEFRDLFLKVVGDLLTFSPPDMTFYSPEMDNARVLAATVRQLDVEVKTYAADRAAAIEKKLTDLTGSIQQVPAEWLRYQNAASNESVDVALDTIAQAPAPMRDYLVQQVVTRVANGGDVPRAQQIIAERIGNPAQREQALYNLRQQAVTNAAEKGRIDEALTLVSKFKAQERINLITQILDHIGPQTKRSLAVQYLEQAKSLITTSPRARDAQQMDMLLEIAATLGRYDATRALQIVDPLIDQFNEISAAALSMNGFGHDFYADGELITSNDNPVASAANQLSNTLATLAMFDFDRAKTAADGIQRMDVRLSVFLAIAQRTLKIEIETPEDTGYGYNQD